MTFLFIDFDSPYPPRPLPRPPPPPSIYKADSGGSWTVSFAVFSRTKNQYPV